MTLVQAVTSIPIKIPQEKITAFCRQHHIRKLALFGSVLREDFSPESDLDLLVEFEPETRIGLLAFAKIQRELSELLQRPVDLVTPEGLKPLIKDTILNSAQVIYAS
ncbi:MAG: nucleotidyltransferase family protein [Anaerolineae bacterium]